MGIGDKLLAKTASVTVKDAPAKAAAPRLGEPKTSPGRMLAAQSAVAAAEQRVAELEKRQGSAVELALDDIVLVPGRRRRLSPEQYAELKENLRQHPLVHPVTVVRRPDGTIELTAGYNRFHIYRELGRATIPAVFREFGEEEAVELAAFYSNLLSPSLPDFEKYLGFVRRQERSGLSQKELATEAGITEGQISKLFAYAKLPEGAVEVLQNGTVPDCLGASAAHDMAKFVSEHPESKGDALELIKRLASDPSFNQKQALEQLKKAVRPVKPAAGTPRVLKTGKRQFCTITSRNGVVALRFKDVALAHEWEQRIADWLEAELKKSDVA